MKGDGQKVYIHIGSHGGVNRIQFKDKIYTAAELAACIKKVNAAGICITLEACKAGSLKDEISAALAGRTGVTITATDENEASHAWTWSDGTDGNSYFVEDFITCWCDPAADGPDAGTDVSQSEAHAWVLVNGRNVTKKQNPELLAHGLATAITATTGIPISWGLLKSLYR